MELLIGLVMVTVGIMVAGLGRPAAGGRFSAFVAKPGMGTAAALVMTILVTFGAALTISGVAAGLESAWANFM